MTEEELNQIKAVTYDAAWRGALSGGLAAGILIAIFIWLFWYGGFSMVLRAIGSFITIIFLIISALPNGTFVYLDSVILSIFVLAILWSIGKEWYVAKRKRESARLENWTPPVQEWHVTPTPKEWPPTNPDKLKTWSEYK